MRVSKRITSHNTVMEFGFNSTAELINGRLAMIGFTIGVLTELFTGHGILSQLGLM